ncbi:MAG TPA: phage tail tape measure protein [Thermoguttaceae bacterium]|nr:phage tail tape measure protein [Thermoguttaceae bacterium]
MGGLEYAAKQSGVSTQGLATGIRQLAKNSVAAASGSKEMAAAFEQLGVDAAALAKMTPDEQLKVMADKLSAVENPTLRAALAMKVFGRSGTELLPLLLEGSQGIDALIKRAETLGLIMGGEEAKRLREFGDLLEDMWISVKTTAVAIGSSLTTELKGAVEWFINVAKATRDWIKEHKGLIVSALKITTAIVAGGLAVSAFGKILGLMAGGVGLLLVPFKLLGGLVGFVGAALAGGVTLFTGVLSALGGLLSFLVTPIGIVAAAIVGLGAYFLYSSGVIGKVVDWLKGVWSGLAADATKAFGGIRDAIMAGRIDLAFKVLASGIQLEFVNLQSWFTTWTNSHFGSWQALILNISKLWVKLEQSILDMFGRLQLEFTRLTIKPLTELQYRIMHGPRTKELHRRDWEAVAKDFPETVGKRGILGTDIFTGKSGYDQLSPEAKAALERARKERLQAWETFDKYGGRIMDDVVGERQKAMVEAEKKRAAEAALTQAELDIEIARESNNSDAIAKAKANAAKARKEYDAAVANAKSARDKAEAEGTDIPSRLKDMLPKFPGLGNINKEKINSVGTFGAHALWGMGGENKLDEIARFMEETAGVVKRQLDIMEKNRNWTDLDPAFVLK